MPDHPNPADEVNRSSLIFCGKCGSSLVDVRFWKAVNLAVFRCSRCDHEAVVDGFTIGRAFDEVPAAAVAAAREDRAFNRVSTSKPEFQRELETAAAHLELAAKYHRLGSDQLKALAPAIRAAFEKPSEQGALAAPAAPPKQA